MAFNLEDYEEVKDRIPKFKKDFPDGRIVTQLESDKADWTHCRYKAFLFKDAEEQSKQLILATGYAFEEIGKGMVNKTSHEENCETSAIGRALANAGYAGKHRPSREEMEKVKKGKTAAKKTDTKKPSEVKTKLKVLILKQITDQKKKGGKEVAREAQMILKTISTFEKDGKLNSYNGTIEKMSESWAKTSYGKLKKQVEENEELDKDSQKFLDGDLKKAEDIPF